MTKGHLRNRIADWESHAPWLCEATPEEVDSWEIQLPGEKPWTVLKYGAEGRTISEWTALFLAETAGHEPASASLWLRRWKAERDRAIAGAERSIIDFAGWWSIQAAMERLGPVTGETPRMPTEELVVSKGFLQVQALMESLAASNRLPVAPAADIALSDVSVNCLERDGGVLWRAFLTGSIPAYQIPVLTLWCPDPVTAAWCAASSRRGVLSVLVGPQPPFQGSVTTGCVLPKCTLGATHFRSQLGGLMTVN